MEPLNNTKHELFAQALIKHKGHQTNAYLEIYPKSVSARFCASRLLANVVIQRRVSELLEAEGLGVMAIIKLLKGLLKKKTYKQGTSTVYYSPFPGVKFEVIDRLLKLHGLTGNQIPFSPEQIVHIEQMVKEFEALNQKKQDGAA